MTAAELKVLQAPVKEQYRERPESACRTLSAEGVLDAGRLVCRVTTGGGVVEAGLHEAAGGDGTALCPGDMLLQALVGCAGVTLAAVATALEIPMRGASIRVEGDLDFRGTLGVDREARVGFSEVRLVFLLDTDAPEDRIRKLIELTERYCVVYQSLRLNPRLVSRYERTNNL